MIQGTTPTHYFTLPFSADIVANARIVYAQNERVVLKKELPDCECDGNVISVKLSQEETLLFDCNKPVEIQMRVLTNADDSLVSNINVVTVARCLDREVLS